MRDETVRDDMMRDDTMRDEAVGYDQPRTDPIPAAPGDQGFAGGRSDPDDPRPDSPAEPGYGTEPGYTEVPPDRAVPSAGPVTDDPGYADPAPGSPDAMAAGPGTPGATPTPTATPTADPASTEDSGAVLFGDSDVERFRGQWRDLQAGFVDNPQEAVRSADQLVDEVLRALTEIFQAHKQELETQWQGGETEELRLAMRRYRSFFDQLLNA